MQRIVSLSLCAVLGLVALGSVFADDKGNQKVADVFKFKMKKLDGKEADLSGYQGKVVLFVNVASQCGYTPQYKGLEALHEKYAEKGLAVVGVPANDFGAQEPGSDAEIAQFCSSKYGVKFDMLSKVTVKGDKKCDLYKYLTTQETAWNSKGEVKWNFEKFLIGRDGKVVGRFGSGVAPDAAELTKAIEAELAKK
ncbi:MAG: glutathione peroxidase [Planctomycetaceae bacterium]|jgi:glutathione peroxidase